VVRPALLSVSLSLLAVALPLRAADDTATRAYQLRIAAICAAGAEPETPDDLANELGRVARQLDGLPNCGVQPDVVAAAEELRAAVGDLESLVRRATVHRRRYGDSARVFVEALARSLVGEHLSLGREIALARAALREDRDAAEAAWQRCRRILPAATLALNERCQQAIAHCRASLRTDPQVVAALGLGQARAEAGDQRALIDDCTHQIDANPAEASAYLLRGAARLSAKVLDGVGGDLDTALRLEPDYAFARALRGRLHAAREEYREALADSDAALAVLPANSFAHCTRGFVLGKTGQLPGALAECAQALRGNPFDGLAHAVRGAAHGALGHFEDAVEDCSGAIHLGAEEAWVYYNRGRAHAQRQEFSDALADLADAIRLAPNSADSYRCRAGVYRFQGKRDQALADLDEAIRLQPRNAEFRDARAQLQCERGAPDKALADLDEAIRIEPGNAVLYLHRGMVHRGRGDVPRALADFAETVRHDPVNVSYHHLQASVFADFGETDKSLSECEAALRLGSDDAGIYAVRALCRLRQGDIDRALADSGAALRRNVNHPVAQKVQQTALEQRRLRAILARSAPGPLASPTDPNLPPLPGPGAAATPVSAPDVAKTPWEKDAANPASGSGPEAPAPADTADRHYEEGRVHLNAGRFHEAILAFDRALRRDPEDSFAYMKRGMAHAALNEYSEALADFTKVAELDPKNAKAYLYRAHVHLHLKDAGHAAADCTAALRLHPDEAEAYLCRGNAHNTLKKYAEARDDFRAAAKLAPASAVAHNAVAWLLATCPDSAVRDGAKAVEAGTRACELSAWGHAHILDTLAAAYAECGKFDEAIKWQQKAVDLAADRDREELRSRLELFKQGKPYRQP
jgi:tetratricopeptide (TPR) repeat protein